MEKILKHYQEIAKYWEDMANFEKAENAKLKERAEIAEQKVFILQRELNKEKNRNYSSVFYLDI